MKWREVILNEICTSQYGYTASAEEQNVGLKFLRITDIVPETINWLSVPYCAIDEEDIKKYKLEKGDIVIARTGNTTGYAKLIRDDVDAVFASYLIRLRVNPLIANPQYIGRLIESKIYKSFVNSIKGGSAQGNANAKMLTLFKFKIPPLPIQQKIADILSKYDDLIENNRRRIELLERSARLLYKEWFVRLRFPGHEHTPIIDGIPEGWENTKITNLCYVIDGTHDSPKPVHEGYYLVTGRHITDGFIDFSKCYVITDEDHQKVMQRSRPETGDIIFSNIGTLGSTVLVDNEFEFSIKNVALFKPFDKNYSSFMFLYFSDPATLRKMEIQSSGTSQKFFSLKFLRGLHILTPNKTLLRLFNDVVEPALKQRSLLHKYNQKLKQARDILLPKLMNGEIEV
jgi:type I restriction enzyme S subunit